MSTFTPPLVKDRPPFLEDSTPIQKELWRHFERRNRGVNVWKLSDGSYVQDTATAENSNTDLSNVYPWNATNPTAPYVTSYYIDAAANPQTSTAHTTSHALSVVAFYAGGSSYTVSAAEAAALTAYTAHGTGYGGRIT